MNNVDVRLILDNAVFVVGAIYAITYLIRYHFTKYSVINTEAVHTAYFNIMWSKRK